MIILGFHFPNKTNCHLNIWVVTVLRTIVLHLIGMVHLVPRPEDPHISAIVSIVHIQYCTKILG
jgi:hypothetical protein